MTKIKTKINRGLVPLLIAASLAACSPNAEDASTSNGKAVDLIVLGESIVTMDANDTIYNDGAIAIDDGLIVAE